MSNGNKNAKKRILNHLVYYNINSLLNKLDDVKYDIDHFQRHGDQLNFIAMTETKLYKSENRDFNINGFRAFFKNSQDGYGGVALYVSNDLKYCREIFSENKYNVNMIVVSVPDLKINIGVIYKPPSVIMTDFLPIFRRFLRKCDEAAFPTIIVGDMNIDLMKISKNHDYLHTICEHKFRVLNELGARSATRVGATSKKIIDHVLTNCHEHDLEHEVAVGTTDLSDHKYIHVEFY